MQRHNCNALHFVLQLDEVVDDTFVNSSNPVRTVNRNERSLGIECTVLTKEVVTEVVEVFALVTPWKPNDFFIVTPDVSPSHSQGAHTDEPVEEWFGLYRSYVGHFS